MLGTMASVRQIFKRWMQWAPNQQGWLSYIRFELHYKEIERAQLIFNKFVQCHCKASVWIKYSKFEVKNGETARARTCFERGTKKMIDNGKKVEELLVAFVEYEEQSKEIDKARCIYSFTIDRIEDVIYGKKRFEYEEHRKNPWNYDLRFDYIRLEESMGCKEKTREVYERAIANVPPVEEKRYWQRYIYLWINYAYTK
ncbi:Crooked neck-like protein 1 [Camellia lanceoleosa]|uniref:Crooked neck-like protein 1 n=1 Tax=Camellia lanceoleosa TaxID=1840588 RepID=A0ACC0GPW2_9ERIC|nr:Crooked neck-like protein 1 [Camellia lanceoleosa]